ncbi:hypothetical protein JOF56_007505 [Kibdelosporangium banguiense]|uniref:PqqD family protein n=1 Tax=Kibdelosporangium banguiense TaxID=1365924 RepID=A0ABS4TRS1_9PSEU|nr:hypothetical protein [Kibdelosporangium banguiense]MBP2327120.1 hypothetical protein [Kibdelosporangium banguiense]
MTTTINTAVGVTQRMLPNGHLELVCHTTRRHVECAPAAAAMWIMLKQHDGDIDRAAAILAGHWNADPAEVRYDMVVLVGSLCAIGLLTEA